MRKLLALLLIPALAIGGCDPEPTGGHPQPKKNAGQAQQPPAVDPGAAQPAPVQGDPSAHNTQPGELDLYVEWSSQNRSKPSCEWSINKPGVGTPCANIRDPQQFQSTGRYNGLWGTTVTAKSGDVVFLTAQGNAGTEWIQCRVEWKGKEINVGVGGYEVAGRHCGGTLKLP
jgi:hypothetical protein